MVSGFYRIASGIPKTHVGNPQANAKEIAVLYRTACAQKAAALVTPELSLTGATCGDLFDHPVLLDAAESALDVVRQETAGHKTLLVVGLPIRLRSRLFDCAVVLQNGHILGVTAKTYPANHRASYEKRYFRSALEFDGDSVTLCGEEVPFGNDLLFQAGKEFVFALEMLDDLRAVTPPSADLVLQGATVLLVPGAEPETANAFYQRNDMLAATTKRLSCICALANAGVHESTTDGVFSGEAAIYEDGECLAVNPRFEREGAFIYTEVKPAWREYERRTWSEFNDCAPSQPCRVVEAAVVPQATTLKVRSFDAQPFVSEGFCCDEVMMLQASALAHRMEVTHTKSLVVGLSGGLDSTLALLVCVAACDLLGLSHKTITVITMPGMGTTSRTHDNARDMAKELKTNFREIPIGDAVRQHFKDIGHDPKVTDVTYENSQARERTQILMDVANELNGIVIGTGDLSEIALGWCTFNGDHMAMYSVNADVPKTLIRRIVASYADYASKKLAAVLRDILDTPVSPELVPGGNQKTECILGSYDLHDFFLYHLIRHGETPENLLGLAQASFDAKEFPAAEIKRVLQLFLKRFFTQQFKRNCSPDGPKVLSFALSPRGDWKAPSDADATLWNL